MNRYKLAGTLIAALLLIVSVIVRYRFATSEAARDSQAYFLRRNTDTRSMRRICGAIPRIIKGSLKKWGCQAT